MPRNRRLNGWADRRFPCRFSRRAGLDVNRRRTMTQLIFLTHFFD